MHMVLRRTRRFPPVVAVSVANSLQLRSIHGGQAELTWVAWLNLNTKTVNLRTTFNEHPSQYAPGST